MIPDGLRIGVNRAVLAVPCDWWAFIDWQTYAEQAGRLEVIPRVLTTRESVRCMVKHGLVPPDATLIDDIAEPGGWRLFTMTAAMVFASLLARSIYIIGADMVGDADWDGATDPRNTRTAARWRTERELFAATRTAIEAKGIMVFHGTA